jgi:leucyl/phenylalanyl-tRNA--protein transferase
MPIFELNEKIIFPPVHLAEKNGILAVGGDLSPERLTAAYSQGIFPWYSKGEPIIWWSPDPRFVLFPRELQVSKTMRQVLRRKIFEITMDEDFSGVIQGCQEPRKQEQGTWITREMRDAYLNLHEIGIAHSIESWRDGELAGGLYGVSLGKCFFGESMFARASNASKAAFITLVRKLDALDFLIIDCQVYTEHLFSLGGRFISRDEYLDILSNGLRHRTIQGSWMEM